MDEKVPVFKNISIRYDYVRDVEAYFFINLDDRIHFKAATLEKAFEIIQALQVAGSLSVGGIFS